MAEEKKSLQDTLISSGKQFLLSPAGSTLLSKLATASGINDVKTFIEDAKAVKELVDDNTPVIKTFTTKGRIYNKATNEPAVGVIVKPQLALIPMVLETKTRKIKIDDPSGEKNKITGKVKKVKIEETYKEYVWDSKATPPEIKTDERGEYEIRFGVPTLPRLGDTILVKPIVLYEKEEFAPDFQTLVTQQNEVLGELPIKALINIEDAADEAVIKLKAEANKAAEKLSGLALSVVEQGLLAVKSQILKFASVIQNKLFPLAIGLFIIFGITKIASANQKEAIAEGRCPSDALLRMAIKRRNSIVRQINQIWTVIIINTALAAIFLYLSSLFKSGKIQISSLGFPTAVPPGVGVPYSIIALLEDIKEKFEILVGINKELRKALLISLIFLIIALIIILRYLKKIDNLISACAIPSDLSMTEINDELLKLQDSAIEDDKQSLLKIVNGFEMNVVEDTNSEVGGLYRRYATASNSQGVVILKGEASFSSVDQILIDELAFYIQQNNLKAD
tara:strand:+ start:2125 stop:3648 length:1524 start_codon:yes stop_codon:yes gene_type:complete